MRSQCASDFQVCMFTTFHLKSGDRIDSPTSHIRLPAEHVDKALNFLQCPFENNESNNCITVVYMYYITIDYCLQQLSCARTFK